MRRRAVVAVIALLISVAVAMAVAARINDDRDAEPAAQPDRAAVGGAPATAYTAQPGRRFIRVGTTTDEPFTDAELRFLADNFDVVLFTKFHGGSDIRVHHSDARRLVALRGDIQVYPYFSTKYWFDSNKWDGAEINPAWLLRDTDGEIVYRDRKRDQGRDRVTYVDLANPAYRAWALEVLRSWLAAAPYAGISFDAAEPIGDYGDREIARWRGVLSQERLREYNAGLRALLQAASTVVGPKQDVVFNGIAPSDPRGPNRNLDLLELTDGALDERFCLDVRGEVHAVEDDIELLTNLSNDKRLFLRTNFREDFPPAERPRYQRFCLGIFLLGWEPGRSYFQFGADYTAEQLREQSPDLNVNLGVPTGRWERTGDLATRAFANGILHVNLGEEPAVVELDQMMTEVRGGELVQPTPPGRKLTVAPKDAVFLLDPAKTG